MQNEQNRKQMFEAERKLERFLSDDGWILCKQTKDGSKLMKQYRNNEPTVYLFSSSVSGVSVQQLAQLINPLGPYRIQWDTQLKEIELLERVNKDDIPNSLKIRRLMHSRLKGLVSERETIDLCRFYNDGGRRVVVMTDTNHPSDVPKAGIVRARTHLSALVIEQNENVGVDVTAIMQMSAFLIGLPTFFKESYFANGITKFFEDMKKACQNNVINDHNYEMPPGW